MSAPTREDVEHARGVLAGRIRRTPTLGSNALGVSLKAELFQETGSFKARGALNRLTALTPEERERGVVTWSAGNHAQAVAWAAAAEGVNCLVQMWEGVSPLKVEVTRIGFDTDLEAIARGWKASEQGAAPSGQTTPAPK